MVQMKYSDFVIGGENTMTVEQLIRETVSSLQGEDDYIELEDGTHCHNEQELKQALQEGGIL